MTHAPWEFSFNLATRRDADTSTDGDLYNDNSTGAAESFNVYFIQDHLYNVIALVLDDIGDDGRHGPRLRGHDRRVAWAACQPMVVRASHSTCVASRVRCVLVRTLLNGQHRCMSMWPWPIDAACLQPRACKERTIRTVSKDLDPMS